MGESSGPSLLASCCNWVNTSQKTVDQLENQQNMFIQVQMRTAQSYTKVILRTEVAMLGMKHRLWTEKVCATAQEEGEQSSKGSV